MASYATDTLMVEEWIFVGLTFVDGEQLMYVNGEHVRSDTEAMYVTSIEDVIIGRTASNNNNYFSGDIDDIRLYNAVLSGDDIETLYHAGDWDLP